MRTKALALTLPLSLLAWLGLSGLARADEATEARKPILLRLAVKEGKSLRYNLNLGGDLTISLPEEFAKKAPKGLSQPLHFRMSSVATMKSQPGGTDSTKLSLAVDSLQLDVRGMDRSVAIQADKNAAKVEVDGKTVLNTAGNAPTDFPFAALVFGREFLLLEFDDRGDLLNIGAAGLLTAVTQPPIVAQVLGKLAEVFPPLLPKGPVRPGAAWDVPIEIDLPESKLSAGGVLRFTFQDVTEASGAKVAHLVLRGQITVEEVELLAAIGGGSKGEDKDKDDKDKAKDQPKESDKPKDAGQAEGKAKDAAKDDKKGPEEKKKRDIPEIHLRAVTDVRGDILLDIANGEIVKADVRSSFRTDAHTKDQNLRATVTFKSSAGLRRIDGAE